MSSEAVPYPCHTCPLGPRELFWVCDCEKYQKWLQVTSKSEEANMDKPRICEVLGVEVGEWWEYGGLEYSVTGKGIIIDHNNTVHFTGLTGAINHPDRIIRRPRFTEQEVEDAKILARALLADGFERDKVGDVFTTSKEAGRTLLDSRMFPSIQPGQSYTLDEIIESNNQ